jgi:archaellum component FlaF (FlaF/FlaG flagellin family)
MDEQSQMVFHDWFIEFLESHQFALQVLKVQNNKVEMRAYRLHSKKTKVEVDFAFQRKLVQQSRLKSGFMIKGMYVDGSQKLCGFIAPLVYISINQKQELKNRLEVTEQEIRSAWQACNAPGRCSCGTILFWSKVTGKYYCSAICWLPSQQHWKNPVGRLKTTGSAIIRR